ncbi:hypothetical protein ACG04Q_17920 [Roseateles sp. DXS20W]|uniref:Uncharacterized protein n=1 Tax=Pelomonas lactea TaxID=3299030 RepID=A0ABW7GNP3_9BURK
MQVSENSPLPPAPELWGDPNSDPDLASVMELFLGKTKEDIFSLLEDNYLIRCLDLGAMPDSVLGYYGLGFAEFLFRDDIDEERFGVLLGAFLDATSNRFNFWQNATPLLQKFTERVDISGMNGENKAELTEELDAIRSRIFVP